jgi:hypothetical protein
MTKRKSFIIHNDSLTILDDMTNEQAGILIKSIKFYQKNGVLPELDFGLKMAITPFINQFIRDEEIYQKTCEARRLAGAEGGKQKVANASKSKQKVANLADNENKNKSDNKIESKNKIELSKYTILADGLIFVLEAKMNKKLPTGSQKNYAEEIRKLIEIDLKVRTEPEEDVKRAIQAISNNYGKDYFPVIQSGGSFREKFVKIEDYLKRNQNSKKKELSDTYCNLMEKFTNEENDNNSEENDNNSMLD